MDKKSKLTIFIEDKVSLKGLKALPAKLGKIKTGIRAAFNSRPVVIFTKTVKRAGSVIAFCSRPVVAFTNAVRRAGTVATAALAAIGIGSIKAASDMESLQAQLEAVLGSAEKAKNAFDESFDFSTATPFSPEDIVKTRIALESVGVSGAEAVEKVATAAAAMGRNITDVATSVRSMETEPLRNLGIMLKRDGDKFLFEYKTKMGEARKVSATGFADAQQVLLDIMGSRFEGGLQKMSKTFSGLWSTMIGNLRAAMSDFGTEYLPSVKAGVDKVIAALAGLRSSGKLKVWGKAVNDELQKVADRVTSLFEYIRKEGATGIKDMASASKDVVIGLFKMGADAAVKVLAAAVPVIGRVLGNAIKNAAFGKDPAKDKAEGLASFEAKTRAAKDTEAELGKFDYKWGNLNSKNRARNRRKKELRNQYYAELLPGYLNSARADERSAAAKQLGIGSGKTQFQSGLNQFEGMAVLGAQSADKKREEKRNRVADLEGARWMAGRPTGIMMDQAQALYADQRAQERTAVRAATMDDGIPTKGAMETLKRERAETAKVAQLIREVKAGDVSKTDLMLDTLRQVVATQNKQADAIAEVRSQIKNNR